MKNLFLPFQLPSWQISSNHFVDIKQLSEFITALGISNVINQL